MADQTEKILDAFERLNAIPRCSKNESGVRRWLLDWADRNGFSHKADEAGNIVVRIPASQGCEDTPIVVIQGHMDMVCEKTPDAPHNFARDPIISHREGEWLTADNTTLGADNGIAIAYAMVLAETSIRRPPLELLFTVDEETGLNGAKALPPAFIEGRRFINLDSEDEGIFTTGCAGGIDTHIRLPVRRKANVEAGDCATLTVSGLKGGHSGIDIHRQRANANKILARALHAIHQQWPFELIHADGGTRKNAIARDARAIVNLPSGRYPDAKQVIAQLGQTLSETYKKNDPGLLLELTMENQSDQKPPGLVADSTHRVLNLLLALPHGVYGICEDHGGVVETSCNLATLHLDAQTLIVTSSQRSASLSRLSEMTDTVHAVALLAGAQMEDLDFYPPWPEEPDSALLKQSIGVYRSLFAQDPAIQIIHAGLECAVIGGLYDGMDMISFGPTIRDPHSPAERLHVPSISKVWHFLTALLDALTRH